MCLTSPLNSLRPEQRASRSGKVGLFVAMRKSCLIIEADEYAVYAEIAHTYAADAHVSGGACLHVGVTGTQSVTARGFAEFAFEECAKVGLALKFCATRDS